MKSAESRVIPIVPATDRKMRVLVAEDNTVVRLATRSLLLSRWRLDLRLVEDGEQAMKAALEIEFDLVLMDLQMPVMNGFDATLGIRSFESENPTRRRTPVVAYTSNDSDDIAGQVKHAGIDAVLKKPCSPHAMCQLLHQWGRGRLERVREASCDCQSAGLQLA
jgi:two-component system, sensor histidine kinase